MHSRALASHVLLLLLVSAGTTLGGCGGAIATVDGTDGTQPGPTDPPSPPSPPSPLPTPYVPPNPGQPPVPGEPPTSQPDPIADPSTLPVQPLPPADVPTGSASEQLQWMKSSIVGTWRGVATSPWKAPYGVEITFTADLHYSAHCLGTTSNCLAFYYGSDSYAATHVYDLVDVQANHEGVGGIYVWPSAGSWTGDLKRVTFHGNASRLTFAFSNGNVGPILYDVTRVK